MIRFELGNQICVCLSDKQLSLELNNSTHSSIPISRIEYLLLSTIAAFGNLNAPISQRNIEKKLLAQYQLVLPENGFKNSIASLRKKFRHLTQNHVSMQQSLIENIHRKGYFVPFHNQHAQKDGLRQQESIDKRTAHSIRTFIEICLRNRLLYLNNDSYTTHTFELAGATAMVRVKNINITNNIENHMSRMFLSGMKVCTNTGPALEIGDTKGQSFLYNVNGSGYREVYYVTGPVSSILALSLLLIVLVNHKLLRSLLTYMWAIRHFK
ncbi:EAL domain-containing protein, partial [Vibrio rotiferianus]